MCVGRMHTATHPNRDLQCIWAQALKWQPGEGEEPQADLYATVRGARVPPPMQLVEAHVTMASGSIILQTDNDRKLIYTINPVFATLATTPTLPAASQLVSGTRAWVLKSRHNSRGEENVSCMLPQRIQTWNIAPPTAGGSHRMDPLGG